MKLAVLLYSDAPNPGGVPTAWPHTVRMIPDGDAVIYPELEMTSAQYSQYVADHQAAYDAWEYQHDLQKLKLARTEMLWKAAYDYNFQYFSGGAFAQILELKFAGVTSAAAAQGWILQLWGDYYQRKYAMATAETPEAVTTISLDFTNHGPPPFTVPQMLAEAQTLGLM